MNRSVSDIDIEMIKEIIPKLQRDFKRLEYILDFFDFCIKNYKEGEDNAEILDKRDLIENEGYTDFEAIEIIE